MIKSSFKQLNSQYTKYDKKCTTDKYNVAWKEVVQNVECILKILYLPIGRKDDSKVCTTNFKPGALFITLNGLSDLSNLKTYKFIITKDHS